MKILIVSATEKEIFHLKDQLYNEKSMLSEIDFLITGVGSVFTTYSLLRKISVKDYDLIINAGIAGSFNQDLQIGDVVFIKSDEFADLGIEDKTDFRTMFETGFIWKDQFPFKNGKLENPYTYSLDIKSGTSITVNTTHGCKQSVEVFKNKFNADLETMEGAAFFYVCLQEGVKFMQVRSISNYVEERNTDRWNIPLAVKNLNQKLFELISVLEKEQ